MLRILAFDIGEKRIGVAVSDPLGITAQGIETYHRTDDLEKDVDHLIKLANGYKPVKLVFGLPRNMDGSYGFQAQITREFAEAVLEKWDGDHAFQDERLTTASARRVLLEADVSRDKRKQVIDKVAAVVILQGYLDAHGNK
ncbi:MAG: Holliday junction resolvase RuvX [Firmicutes bacterium HGW-Firmicutes-9]|jgi:putative Holliday junction resolvase|nr:MAG: Holliday junction resolvase RuvX [Firmicutes bacterium HGW-Firmicutes-9]